MQNTDVLHRRSLATSAHKRLPAIWVHARSSLQTNRTLPVVKGGAPEGRFKTCNCFCGRQIKSRKPLAVCPAIAQQRVFPPSTTVTDTGTYRLRLYEPFYVIQTSYSRRDKGFEALGHYLGGGNGTGLRFPAAQPVFMDHCAQGKLMSVYLHTEEVRAGEFMHT